MRCGSPLRSKSCSEVAAGAVRAVPIGLSAGEESVIPACARCSKGLTSYSSAYATHFYSALTREEFDVWLVHQS